VCKVAFDVQGQKVIKNTASVCSREQILRIHFNRERERTTEDVGLQDLGLAVLMTLARATKTESRSSFTRRSNRAVGRPSCSCARATRPEPEAEHTRVVLKTKTKVHVNKE
jgi:hypothetical protein